MEDEESEEWLFKIPRENTGEHWAEKVACEVARLLNIPCAEIELAKFKDTLGSCSKSFINKEKKPELIHGNEILAGRVFGYEKEKKYGQSDHTFQNIREAIEKTGKASESERALKHFAGYLFLDSLIGNTDRHHENWAFLRWTDRDKQTHHVLAPTFDYASSFGRELLDEKRALLLSENRIEQYIDNGHGAIYWVPEDKKGLNPFELVKLANDKIPEAFNPWLERVQEVEADQFEDILSKVPDSFITEPARKFALKMLRVNLEIKKTVSMRTVYLAWQDKGKTRAWFPIGRLDADLNEPVFKFGYVKGAERAHKEAGFQPLDAFPDFERQYISSELFPLFQNRIMNKGRSDFLNYLELMDLNPAKADPITILEVSGGTRRTDNLEVFPKISKNEHGEFHTRFFLKGWRYVNEYSKKRVQSLEPREELRVTIEMNNPATRLAVQLQSSDYCMVGWTPRYLVNDILECISKNPLDICAEVVKVNPAPAPSQERVLVEIRGRWPKDYEPMNGPDFKAMWKKGIKWLPFN